MPGYLAFRRDSGFLHGSKGSLRTSISKLGERLRSHDWTAAVIELVIVVVGIQADLVADRQSIDETLAFSKTVLAYYQASQLLPFQLEAGVVLDSYQHSEALLENLRFWMSTLGVSSIVLNGAREDAVSLAADVDAARAK